MRLPFQLLSLAAVLLSPLTDASSTKRNPIGSVSTVRNATIHTNNGRVTALSHFDLTFLATDDLYIKLSLEPNHDILAEDTLITHLGPDGTITHKENVDRLGHKVFKGTTWIWRPSSDGQDWHDVGWARVSIHDDGKRPFFDGVFSITNNYHHIQSSTNYLQTKHELDPEIAQLEDGEEYMVMWRDSDIQPMTSFEHEELRRRRNEDEPSCHYDDMVFNRNPEHPVLLGLDKRSSKSYGALDFSYLLGKRQIDTTTGGNSGGVDLKKTIGDPAGCPTTRKVALVGVATDCTYTSALGSKQAVTKNVISQMNQASGVWEGAFNISLGLQNLTISDASCPGSPQRATEWNQECSGSVDIQTRLNYFSAWRADQGGDNSHWTLLSTCNTGSAVGLAWLGQACVGTSFSSNDSTTGNGPSSGGETVSGANVVIRTSGANEWQIIAHETGHTFGAVHDCDSQTCQEASYVASQQCCPYTANTCDAGGRYIMNPYTEPGVDAFSPCTIGNICSAIGRRSVDTSCLSDNKNVQTFTGQQCGNGIVEPGEECDCGGEAGCDNDPCCNPDTCKFTSGSVCDDFNDGCCVNCQFASKGTVCRASTGECDPKEVCPGDGGNCPPDKTKPNGESCGSNGLQCISGQCTSRDQQCKTVMGSYSNGNDTSACNSESCTISCTSPEFGYGTCYGLQQNFLDGTPCGGNGQCENVSFSPYSTRIKMCANAISGPMQRRFPGRRDQILDR